MGILRRQRDRAAVQQIEASRGAIHLRLEAGETVESEGPGWDVSLNGAPAWIVVTARRVLWALLQRPDVIMDTPFEKVHEAMKAEGQIKLVARDPAYATMLKDPSNPFGETDTILGFPEDVDYQLRSAIESGLRKFSPAWADHRAAIEHFNQRQEAPVTRWTDCPMCGGSIDMRTEHAIHCGGKCGRYFTDPGFQPTVSESPNTYGQLLGDEPWMPLLLAEVPLQHRTRPWIIRPQSYSVGPLIVADGHLEQDALDHSHR